MIPALDPDPELDFQLYGDSRSGFGSSKKWNCKSCRGVLTPAQDPDPRCDFQPIGKSYPDSNPLKSGIVTTLMSICPSLKGVGRLRASAANSAPSLPSIMLVCTCASL